MEEDAGEKRQGKGKEEVGREGEEGSRDEVRAWTDRVGREGGEGSRDEVQAWADRKALHCKSTANGNSRHDFRTSSSVFRV